MSEPERRRRRPAVSCSICRKRKLRCNREIPCSNCVRSKNVTCIYENHGSQPLRQPVSWEQQSRDPVLVSKTPAPFKFSTPTSNSSLVSSSANASSAPSELSSREIESIKTKIRQLEEQLSKASPKPLQSSVSTPDSKIETTTSSLGGTFYVHRQSNQPTGITRGITHKTRQFGQSHWINTFSLFRGIIMEAEPHLRDSNAAFMLQKCKALGRFIKARRAPTWPCMPTVDLPPREVADQLLNCYFRTTEAIYRILHIPSFKREYEALWVSDTPSDMSFLVQLKLVFAIGATTFDEKYSMRNSAIKWVYEAQTWLSEPTFKSRLNTQFLQMNILLLLAREFVDIGGDQVWTSAGALFRTAVYMGLHRDPVRLPPRTVLAAEMRRRLWNTILELSLRSSLTSGGPPLLSLDDFDTEPPGNFDDEQLSDECAIQKSEESFTQASVAIALRRTFPLRLTITKFLNDIGSNGIYDEALRLDAEMRKLHRTLYRTIQAWTSSTGFSLSLFEIRLLDFTMHRYLSALHIPFFGLGLQETKYAFSRKVVVDNALKIWCAGYPESSILAGRAQNHQDRNDFARLVICGNGFSRTIVMQAAIFMVLELKAQLQEEEGLTPVPLRPDLLSILDDAPRWCLSCVEKGEVNIKGFFLMSVLTGHVKGLMQGLGSDNLSAFLIKAGEDALGICLPILERMATDGDEMHQMSLNTPSETMEDWNFMMSDSLLNQENLDAMNWMFNSDQSPLW